MGVRISLSLFSSTIKTLPRCLIFCICLALTSPIRSYHPGLFLLLSWKKNLIYTDKSVFLTLLRLNIPVRFICFILLDKSWIVKILIIWMAKSCIFAKLLTDQRLSTHLGTYANFHLTCSSLQKALSAILLI